MRRLAKYLLFLTATGQGILLFGQDIPVRIVDATDNTPVPYCHICIEHLGSDDKAYFVSDINGEAIAPLHGNDIVSVTAIGYQSYFDTLSSVKNPLIIRLERDLFKLGEVVVTGHGKPVSRDQSIYHIDFISKNQIENQAANNLADVLDKQLNISINNDPSTGTSLKLQGISGENIQILVDGVPVIGRLDGNIDLSQINLENADHIEIIEGPMSVMYGSNALAGVVNIITRENKHAKFRAGVHGYYESVGTYNINGNVSFKAGNNELMLNGGRNFFDGYSLTEGSRMMEWKPKEQYNAGLNYNYRTENLNIRYKTDLFSEDLLDRNDPYPQGPYPYKGNDVWFHTLRYNNNIHLDKDFSERTSVSLLLGYSFYERNKEIIVKDLTNQYTLGYSSLDSTRFHSGIARGILTHQLKNSKLNFYGGFDINTETAIGERIKNGEENIGDYAIFGSLQYEPLAGLVFQPGLRFSYNTKYNSPLVPSFNVKYNFGKGAVRGSYARGFRAPSLKELYLYFYDSSHEIEGNENLKAENSHNFNVNLNYYPIIGSKSFDFGIKSFYNSINDRITLVKVDPNNELHYRNENTDHFQSLGGDVSVQFDPVYFITLYVGGGAIGWKDSYYEAENFEFSPAIASNLSARFIKNRLTATLIYKYSGKYPDYTYNENDEIELEFLEPYHNMDFTTSVKLFKQTVIVSSGVKNIFNNTRLSGVSTGSSHGESGGISSLVGWGRTFFVSLKYNFVRY